MTMEKMINVVVEGRSDDAAARAVVAAAGRHVVRVVVADGKTRLDPKIRNYHRAARQTPWVVFRDSDGRCPVELRDDLLFGIDAHNPRFALRIAHSMTEAWLMADRRGFAGFFGVSSDRLRTPPEDLPHAKQTLLQLCRNSRKRAIRTGVVRPDGVIGAEYVNIINEFARDHWDVKDAMENSPSLRRAVEAISGLP